MAHQALEFNLEGSTMHHEALELSLEGCPLWTVTYCFKFEEKQTSALLLGQNLAPNSPCVTCPCRHFWHVGDGSAANSPFFWKFFGHSHNDLFSVLKRLIILFRFSVAVEALHDGLPHISPCISGASSPCVPGWVYAVPTQRRNLVGRLDNVTLFLKSELKFILL